MEWEREVCEVKRQSYRERDQEKWGLDHTRRIYRTSVNLDRRRCWEVLIKASSQVLRIWPSTDTGVEEVSRYKTSNTIDKARSIHQVLRSYRGDRNFLGRLTKCDTPIWLIVWCVWVCDESHIGYLLGRLGFINNYKKPQLWLVLLRYSANVASAFPWVVTYGIRASSVILCGLKDTTPQSGP